jgi:hypothetical protein
MMKLAAIASFLLVIAAAPSVGAAPFETNIEFAGGFHIYGHQPVPQTNGFDYYFTPVHIDATLAGKLVRVTEIQLTVVGQNNGSVVNWDLETFVGPSDFGLPQGQFIQTHVDPVAGYLREAPISQRSTVQSVSFSLDYTFPIGSVPLLELNDGLHTQLFFWTADNRNCNVSFDSVMMTIAGDAIPEPTGTSVVVGFTCAAMLRRRRSPGRFTSSSRTGHS